MTKSAFLSFPAKNYGLTGNAEMIEGVSGRDIFLYCFDQSTTDKKMQQFGQVISKTMSQYNSDREPYAVRIFFTSSSEQDQTCTESTKFLKHSQLVAGLIDVIRKPVFQENKDSDELNLTIFAYGNAADFVAEALLQAQIALNLRDNNSREITVYTLNGSSFIPNCFANNVINYTTQGSADIKSLDDEYIIVHLPAGGPDEFTIFQDLFKKMHPTNLARTKRYHSI